MSAKIAIVIGDYSNGWSDSIQVQQVAKFPQKNLENDRDLVMSVLSKNLLNVVEELEASDKINPLPKDEPCCQHFADFAGKNDISKMRVCPLCATPITKERREKFIQKDI